MTPYHQRLAEALRATYQGVDGQGYQLALMAEDGGIIPPPLPEALIDAVVAALVDPLVPLDGPSRDAANRIGEASGG